MECWGVVKGGILDSLMDFVFILGHSKAFKQTKLNLTLLINDLALQSQITKLCLNFAIICYNLIVDKWIVFVLKHNTSIDMILKKKYVKN